MYCDCYKIKLEDIEKYNVFQRIATMSFNVLRIALYCDLIVFNVLRTTMSFNVLRIAQYIEIHCIPQCNAISLYCEESKYIEQYIQQYGVATNSRLLKIIDLFCKRAL